jgi:hypothetical protein
VKYAQVGFVCDFDRCDEETDPETTWGVARKQAKLVGWFLSDAVDYCPEHRP